MLAGLAATGLCAGVVAIGGGTAGAATATNLHCGSVITASVTLNGTLTCRSYDGTALTVHAPGVTLNLGGHSVASHTFYTAVYDDGYPDVTVENGKIETAWTGLDADAAENFTATSLTFTASTGIDDEDYGLGVVGGGHITIRDDSFYNLDEGLVLSEVETASTVSDNEVTGAGIGIVLEGNHAVTFSGNTVTGADEVGIEAAGTDDVSYSSNVTSFASGPGIVLEGASDTTISRARATFDGYAGIYVEDPGAGVSVTLSTVDYDSEYGIYATSRVGGALNFAVGDPDHCYNAVCT